jgi:hypothetical protein
VHESFQQKTLEGQIILREWEGSEEGERDRERKREAVR